MEKSKQLELLFYVVVAAILLPLVGWLLHRHNQQRVELGEAWRAFAASHGLKASLDADGRLPVLEGTWSGVRVRASLRKHGVDHPTFLAFYEGFFELPMPAGTLLDNRDHEPVERPGESAVDAEVRRFLRDAGKDLRTVLPDRVTLLGMPDESEPEVIQRRLDTVAAFAKRLDGLRRAGTGKSAIPK